MLSTPSLTVGLYVRNGAESIARALNSLVAQDHSNCQIIISDNASTDDTPGISRDYAKRFDSILYVRNDRNIGLIPNARRVVELAHGRYFMWAGDDDWWAPKFASTLVAELEEHPEAVVAMCATERVTEEGTVIDTLRFRHSDSPDNKSYLGMALSLLGFPRKTKNNFFFLGVYPTDVVKAGFSHYPDIPGVERLFLTQMALAGRFRYVDEPLFRKTIHKHSQKERRSDEIYNKRRDEKRIKLKQKTVLVNAILRSPVVPLRRKAYVPVIIVFLFARQVWRTMLRISALLWRTAKPFLPESLVNFLRRRLRFLLPRKYGADN